MKYLSNYTEEGITKALDKAGAFFAFSGKQFKEKEDKGVKKYANLGGGLISPVGTAKQLVKNIADVVKNGIKQDIKENGIDNIIKRELENHEANYTGDITDTAEALKDYGISDNKILQSLNQFEYKN